MAIAGLYPFKLRTKKPPQIFFQWSVASGIFFPLNTRTNKDPAEVRGKVGYELEVIVPVETTGAVTRRGRIRLANIQKIRCPLLEHTII
jgi:hypothetical protein